MLGCIIIKGAWLSYASIGNFSEHSKTPYTTQVIRDHLGIGTQTFMGSKLVLHL